MIRNHDADKIRYILILGIQFWLFLIGKLFLLILFLDKKQIELSINNLCKKFKNIGGKKESPLNKSCGFKVVFI